MLRPAKPEAYRLFHEGILALSQVEQNGVCIDTEYLDQAIREITERIQQAEAELKRDEIYKTWRKHYGDKTKLSGREQLGHIIFNVLGYPCKTRTATGKPKTDGAAFDHVDLPFVRLWLQVAQWRTWRSTFLLGIKRELVGNMLRSSYHLNTAETYRGSCSDPNFQNFPIRNPEAAAIIRRCFKARGKNRCLVEVDFSGIEVKVAASYTHCPALVRYVTDPTTDMHRDMAVELFKLKDPPKEWWKQKGPGGGHDVRHNSKNLFVFPQFYGDYYINCARNLWEAMEKHKLCAPDGRPMRKHMRRNGITELGALDPDRSPRPGTFENHIKDIEDRFWNSRFRGYRDWRRRWWAEYQESGGFITKTGFRVSGIYSKNEVLNNPIQGSAFHCLLWCLVQAVKELRRRKMKSLIIGQIHDSMLADVPVKELDEYLEIVYDLMTRKLLDHWKWIIVPMDVEAEVSPPGGSWHEKQKYDLSKFTA